MKKIIASFLCLVFMITMLSYRSVSASEKDGLVETETIEQQFTVSTGKDNYIKFRQIAGKYTSFYSNLAVNSKYKIKKGYADRIEITYTEKNTNKTETKNFKNKNFKQKLKLNKNTTYDITVKLTYKVQDGVTALDWSELPQIELIKKKYAVIEQK